MDSDNYSPGSLVPIFEVCELNDFIEWCLLQDIALMDEQERECFIKKIGISACDSDDTDDDEEEDDPEHHKYNCKKCQVSLHTSTHTPSSLSYHIQLMQGEEACS